MSKVSCWEKHPYIYSFIVLVCAVFFGFIIYYKFPFSGNEPKMDKNEDINKSDLKIIKKNIIESKFKAIIGIDLGSTTSGYSIIKEPFEDLGTIDIKDLIESQIIIYKLSETGLCIGRECDYIHFLTDPDNKNHLYFIPKINKNMVSSDYPGDEIKINVVIKEFLKIIREKYVNQYINNYNLTDIKWVITVPPLWDIKGKKLMQKQAKNAGMVNILS